MSEEQDQHDELTPFEDALASIVPRVEGFDRERLLFLAGQVSVDRDRRGPASWAWPAAFSVMTAVAASLLVTLCTRPEANPAIHTEPAKVAAPSVAAYEPVEQEPPGGVAWLAEWYPASWSVSDSPATRYAQLRDRLLRAESDVVGREPASPGEATAVAEEALSYHQLLERLLDSRPSGATKRRPISDLD